MVHHIPGRVHIYASKTISIIPVFDFLTMRSILSICKNPVYFFLRKAKKFIQTIIRYCICNKVICSRKNAFLGNPKTACHNRQMQEGIILQSLKNTADHIQHFLIISLITGLSKRHIILIYQQNHRFSIILSQQPCKK